MKKAIRDMESEVDVFMFNKKKYNMLYESFDQPGNYWCKPVSYSATKGEIRRFSGDDEYEIIGRIGADGTMEEV